MHKFMFIDTETTSLYDARKGKPGGEVIQFSAILVSQEFEIERIINRYCSSTQLINPNALAVHGLSDKKIEILSDGKFFETIVEEEGLRNFHDVTWIAHNLPFDVKKINQTLTQNGEKPIDFGVATPHLSRNVQGVFKYDTMAPLSGIHFSVCGKTGSYGYGQTKKHRVSLSNLISTHIGLQAFKRICQLYQEKYSIVDPMVGEENYLHNAFFDVLGLLLLVNKYRNLLLR